MRDYENTKPYRNRQKIVYAKIWSTGERPACYCVEGKSNDFTYPHIHTDNIIQILSEGDYIVIETLKTSQQLASEKISILKPEEFNLQYEAVEKFELPQKMIKHVTEYQIQKKKSGSVIPLIVTLCGSTRFREEYRVANAALTIAGCIVLTCACFKGDPEWEIAGKGILDVLHKQKIDLSDVVVVLNVANYIGESTMSEIEHAEKFNTPILYLNEVNDEGISTRPNESRTLETTAGTKDA
jgi:hypothetical protein